MLIFSGSSVHCFISPPNDIPKSTEHTELQTVADIFGVCYENDKKRVDTYLVNLRASSCLIKTLQALCKVLPERLHPGGNETSIGNVELWRAQCLMVPVVDGQDIGQLKDKTQALVHCCIHVLYRTLSGETRERSQLSVLNK